MALMEKLVKGTIQKDGYAPLLVVWLVRSVVMVIWSVHDNVFSPIFGRGDGLTENVLEAGGIEVPQLEEKPSLTFSAV